MKRKLVFFGDRNSKTIKIGEILKKIFPKLIRIMMFDGYKSAIYIDTLD